ncbi:hypothetical protein OAE88_00705 [bacterium]|nr:hypothetical protein [bacterium]
MAQTKTETTELVDTIAHAVVKANQVLDVEIVKEPTSVTMTAAEYMEYSEKNGTFMGRAEGVKTKLTAEEYVVLKNTPEWDEAKIMKKHGITKEELASVKRSAAASK